MAPKIAAPIFIIRLIMKPRKRAMLIENIYEKIVVRVDRS